MTADDRPAERQLSSWKEVAAHFGRDIRTVQRWEKEEGLPIHRHAHRARHSIYAFPSELDAWWRGHADGTTTAPSASTLPEASGAPRARVGWVALAFAAIATALLAGVALRSSSRGAATSAAATTQVTWRLDAPYDVVVAADFDGDGRSDIALSATEGGPPSIHTVDASTLTLGPSLVTIEGEPERQILIDGAPDLNGDGIADLVVSALHLSPTAAATSPVYLVFGRRTWPERIVLPRDADVRLELALHYDVRLGWCHAATPVDLNRDGLDDVLLSAPEFSVGDRKAAGAVMVVYGRRAWPASLSLGDDADVTVVGSRTGEGLGLACASGDSNGDGWPDLAVQAGEHTLWKMRNANGRTYVLAGEPRWPRRIDLASHYLLRIDNPTPGFPGQHIAMADVNGDGRADLIRATPAPGGQGIDALRVWMGGRHTGVRTGSDQDVKIALANPTSDWARQLLTADLDADGRDDVVLSDGSSGSLWRIPGRGEWPGEIALTRAGTRFYSIDATTKGYSLAATIDRRGLPSLLLPTGLAGSSLHVVPVYDPLPFDLRPDFDRNLVLVPGAVVVRIVGATTDVSTLDASSMRLNGATPTHARSADDDRDGLPDLQLWFESTDMQLDGVTRATLVGRRRNGRLVGGAEPIEIVRRAKANN